MKLFTGSFTALLTTTLFLSACAQDRDVDDYKKTKLNEDLAKVEQVSGNYTGTLKSNSTGEVIGTAGLQLQADTRVNGLNEQQPVLRGVLFFKSSTTIKIIFQNSYFDPETQIFKSSLGGLPSASAGATGSTSSGTASTASPVSLGLDLEGKVDGPKITATLQTFGYPELGATMNLEKSFGTQEFSDAFKPDESSTEAPVELIDRVFIGTYNNKPTKLTINNKSSKPEDRFLDLFNPERRVDATLTISLMNDINFNQVKWDPRNESLNASATRTSSDGPFVTNLTCKIVPTPANKPAQINCEYGSSLFTNRKINLSLTEKTGN